MDEDNYLQITVAERDGEVWDLPEVFTNRNDALIEARKWDEHFEKVPPFPEYNPYYCVTIREYHGKLDGFRYIKEKKSFGFRPTKTAKEKVQEYLQSLQKLID